MQELGKRFAILLNKYYDPGPGVTNFLLSMMPGRAEWEN